MAYHHFLPGFFHSLSKSIDNVKETSFHFGLICSTFLNLTLCCIDNLIAKDLSILAKIHINLLSHDIDTFLLLQNFLFHSRDRHLVIQLFKLLIYTFILFFYLWNLLFWFCNIAINLFQLLFWYYWQMLLMIDVYPCLSVLFHLENLLLWELIQ